MTQDKIKGTAKKLKKMSDSAKEIGSEAEAQAFATKLQEMLAKHNLTMSDIEWKEEVEKATLVLWSRPSLQRLQTWTIQLSSTIAMANHCRNFVRGGIYIGFIGTVAATDACMTTMSYMFEAAKNISQREYDKRYNACYAARESTRHLVGYREAFLVGFIARLQERFKEVEAKLASEFKSTALVRISQSLRKADEYMEESGMKLKDSHRKTPKPSSMVGFMDGRSHANKLNIGGAKLSGPSTKSLAGGN